jgi:hypothetical protein
MIRQDYIFKGAGLKALRDNVVTLQPQAAKECHCDPIEETREVMPVSCWLAKSEIASSLTLLAMNRSGPS